MDYLYYRATPDRHYEASKSPQTPFTVLLIRKRLYTFILTLLLRAWPLTSGDIFKLWSSFRVQVHFMFRPHPGTGSPDSWDPKNLASFWPAGWGLFAASGAAAGAWMMSVAYHNIFVRGVVWGCDGCYLVWRNALIGVLTCTNVGTGSNSKDVTLWVSSWYLFTIILSMYKWKGNNLNWWYRAGIYLCFVHMCSLTLYIYIHIPPGLR